MQELTILKLRFKNFKSFGAQWYEIDFNETLSTFIHGENLDTGSANGAGKTSMYDALVYALYNKSISNISLSRLINSTNAAKNTLMEVEVEFRKAGKHYTVYRKRGAEHGIIFTEDGIDITPDSVIETDTLIEKTIGISYDLFSRIIVFSGSATPFLDLPVAQQRLHIEELFNITILSEKAAVLKKMIQATEQDIKVEEALVKEKNNALDAHQKRIAFAENKVISWETDREETLVRLKASVESIADIDFDHEQKLFDERVKVGVELGDVQAVIHHLDQLLTDLHKQSINKAIELQHLEADKCPYCMQKYQAVAGKIDELKTEKADLDAEIIRIEDELRPLNVKQMDLNVQYCKIDNQISYKDLPSLLTTKNNLDNITKKIEELETAENPHFEAFELLEKEEQAQVDYSKLNELKMLKEHQSFLLKLLTDKNSFIRKKIINRTIPFLNTRLNYYALEIGLPHTIRFDDNMSCSVLEFNRELDFGNLSGGEKKRVNLAMSLAFRDVLHHLHARINILLVDEIDSGLCGVGVQDVVKLLKKKTYDDNLNTWVIMHRSEVKQLFDRQMIIRKEAGFSSLHFEDIT